MSDFTFNDGQLAAGDSKFLGTSSGMAALIRDHDWSSSPLGPISTWPQSLRTTVSLCLASNFPINIVWGPEHIQIYNDGYRVLCGDRHPATLGMDYTVCWESAWSALAAPFGCALRGDTSYLENQRMFLFRNGYLEETFFTFSLSPIRDESGEIGGLFHPVTETTPTMLSERRTRALRDLTARLVGAQTGSEVFTLVAGTLADFEFDLPFLLLYEFDAQNGRYSLRRQSGIGPCEAVAPAFLDAASAGFWPLERVTGATALVELGGLRDALGGVACGPYPEAPDTAFAIPVWRPGLASPVALLLTAASPRLPLSDDYRGFLELIGAAVGAALARVAASEEERRRLEMLAAIDRAKTVFFSNISHEFRTPLTLMLGPLEDALRTPGLPPAHTELLQTADRNAQRLLKLVNALLDFSRLETGRAAVSFQATDLAASTAELASHFSSACERAGLALQVDCPPLPAFAWVDRDMWEKIVLNLLSNAFKFTLHGGIAVRLCADGDAVELAVADSGVGIPADELGRVFERFHRIEGQQGRSMEGTGIGLALVGEMVALHDGTVRIESEVGRGTTFFVRIPLGAKAGAQGVSAPYAPSARAAAYAGEALQWIEGGAGAVEAPSPAAPHQASVLLVDDNRDMRSYIQRALEAAGYRTIPARDGAEALELLRTEPLPDLVISDIMMPRIDGFTLLAAIRADERLRELTVLLLSARAGEEARVEGLAAGADDYIVKPFSARELLARVDGAIRLARLRRETMAREAVVRIDAATASARSALRRSEAQVASLFEQTAAGVAQADLSGRILRANARYCEILGLPEHELIGTRFADLVHPDDVAADLALLAGMKADGQSFEIDNRFLRRDGRVVWVTKAVTRVPGADGEDAGSILSVVLDITERKKAETKLREADRNKDEFLAMLAHELRNPLAPISAAAELMGRTTLDAERIKRTSGIITRQVRHMTELVDDLLDVSRVTRGLVTIDRQPLDMNTIVAAAVEQTRPLIESRKHHLAVTLPQHPAIVDGDQKRLVQVAANLLNNAAKFTPAGGAIGIALESDGREVRLSVSDNGIGISPELRERMFDLFAQATRTPDRSQGGLGLGLALAKSLVELHGGAIDYYSAGPNQGATFTISLPCSFQLPAPGAGPAPIEVSAAGSGLRILLVDDNVDAARTLAMLLEVLGYTVAVEYDSHAALERAAALVPDVCILDIGLPDIDGYALARRLRQRPEMRAATLVAVTGYGEQRDRDAGMAAGFDAYFAKPADIDKLHALLESVARRRPVER